MKLKTFGFPPIFNIEADPKEMVSIAHSGAGWVMRPYFQFVGKYKQSLKDHPNPPAPNVTQF